MAVQIIFFFDFSLSFFFQIQVCVEEFLKQRITLRTYDRNSCEKYFYRIKLYIKGFRVERRLTNNWMLLLL